MEEFEFAKSVPRSSSKKRESTLVSLVPLHRNRHATTHTDQAKDRLEVVLCGNSQKIQAEDKGFEPSTGFPAPDFESGS